MNQEIPRKEDIAKNKQGNTKLCHNCVQEPFKKEVLVSPGIIYILRTDGQVFLTNGLQIDGSLHHYVVLDTA
jgi:hypothetical protein